jgi:VanZ family protein
MLATLRHPRLWQVIGWLLVLGAIYLSLTPGSAMPKNLLVNDKIAHATTYTVLTLWFTGLYPRSRYVWIALCLFALGVFIEFAQGAMELGRQRDYLDVLANTTGICVGLMLALAWLGDWVQRVEDWTRRS